MSHSDLEFTTDEKVRRSLRWIRFVDSFDPKRPFIWIFVPLAVIYLLTASHSVHPHIDPLTNAVAAWYYGMDVSVEMSEHLEATTPEQFGNSAWIVDSPRGPVSVYPPGAAALAAPLYRISGEPMVPYLVTGLNRPHVEGIPFPLPSPFPAAIVAALTSAAAMALMGATVPYAGGTHLEGVVTGLIGGLATSVWAVAADALWQHGPAMLWIALGIYLAARSRLGWAGLAFGAAVLTRPHLALIPLMMGIHLGLSRKDVNPVWKIGAGSFAGLGALLWFNFWVWGEITVSGGYQGRFVGRFLSADVDWFLGNVWGALFDPWHGLIPYSAFLLFLIPGLGAAWKRAPDWGRAAVLGGILYIVVQLKANRFSGGDGFLGYRYPLEALTAASVVLFLAYDPWVGQRPLARRLFWLAVVGAVLLQLSSQIF